MNRVQEIKHITQQMIKCENKVLTNVCSSLLGKPFTKKDAKRFTTKTICGYTMDYDLFFDNKKVGSIKHIFDLNFIGVKFVPIEN